MRKIFTLLTVALVGLFSVTSCMPDELGPVFYPENMVPPVLNSLGAEYTLVEGEDFETFTFTPASYGVSVSIKYSVYADLAGNGFAKAKLMEQATSPATRITVSAAKLNTALIAWGCPSGEPAQVEFKVISQWMGEKSAIGYDQESNVVSTSVIPYMAEREYPKIWVLGGFNGWNHGLAHYLYSYSEDEVNYEGIVDFGENATDPSSDHYTQGFKITGQGNWDNPDLNWGMVGGDSSPVEASELNLMSGNDGQNIDKYNGHRYYKFALNTQTLALKMKLAFNTLGVIGLNGAWGDSDDIEMTFNPYRERFWADVEATSATAFKFRTDHSWDKNWGINGDKIEEGAGDIPLEAGQYRIYFYLNNSADIHYVADPSMFGKEEPGKDPEPIDPEPVVENAWSVIGEVEGSAWDKDFYMNENNGIWTSAPLQLNGQFKIRFNNGWDENRGAEGDSEPVELLPGIATPVVLGGNNLIAPKAGYYIVEFDSLNELLTIHSMANKWSLIGEIAESGWDKDFFLKEVATNLWVSDPVVINGGFKLRYDSSWDVNLGAGSEEEPFVVPLGIPFEGVPGGKNLTVAKLGAEYIVTYHAEDNTILVEAALPSNCWSLIGGVEGTSWDTDFHMTRYASGLWVSNPVTITGEFKLRFNNEWNSNRGGDLVALGEPFAVTHDGANISVPTGEVYQVIYNPGTETITVNPCANAWSVIGQYESYNWDTDFYLAHKGEGIYESDFFKGGAEVKLRFNGGWDVNRGGDFASLGEPFAAVDGGNNIKLPNPGAYYKIIYNAVEETLAVETAWSLIGQVEGTGWDTDFCLSETAPGVWETRAIVNGEFKIRFHSSWDDGLNRGGNLVALGEPFAVETGGPNIAVPTPGARYHVLYEAANETITVTLAE